MITLINMYLALRIVKLLDDQSCLIGGLFKTALLPQLWEWSGAAALVVVSASSFDQVGTKVFVLR